MSLDLPNEPNKLQCDQNSQKYKLFYNLFGSFGRSDVVLRMPDVVRLARYGRLWNSDY